jgi:4-diphosphocytidyl-2C-methyl-D-erythritol kinase
VEEFTEKKMNCEIHLTKSIPIAAGLGGGSSDAAATIIGLNKLFDLRLDKKDLVKIALGVGSDVPYFVSGYGRTRVSGRGEIIKKDLGKPAELYILARPHKRISTKMIFDLYDKKKKPFIDLVSELSAETKEIYNYLSSQSKECGMSGSGPTIFAGFASYTKAKKAIEQYEVKKFNGDFFIVRPVKEPIAISE